MVYRLAHLTFDANSCIFDALKLKMTLEWDSYIQKVHWNFPIIKTDKFASFSIKALVVGTSRRNKVHI